MRYHDAKIENLPVKVQEIIQGNFDPQGKSFKKGLFIYGNTGVGKTYALYAIQKRAREHRMEVTNVENWVELLTDLRQKVAGGVLYDPLEHITSKVVIVIDDLGAEKQTDWSQEILYLIINRIYLKEKTAILSTNYSIEEFQTRYGDRIMSRIAEMCELVELTGEDRRLS